MFGNPTATNLEACEIVLEQLLALLPLPDALIDASLALGGQALLHALHPQAQFVGEDLHVDRRRAYRRGFLKLLRYILYGQVVANHFGATLPPLWPVGRLAGGSRGSER